MHEFFFIILLYYAQIFLSASFSLENKNGSNGGGKSGKSTSAFSCRNLSLRLRRSMFHKLGRRLSEVALSADGNNESSSQRRRRQVRQHLPHLQQQKRDTCDDEGKGIHENLPNRYSLDNSPPLKLVNESMLLPPDKFIFEEEHTNDLVPITPTLSQSKMDMFSKFYFKSFDEKHVNQEHPPQHVTAANKLITEYNKKQLSTSYKFCNRSNLTINLPYNKSLSIENANVSDVDDSGGNDNFTNMTVLPNKTLIYFLIII